MANNKKNIFLILVLSVLLVFSGCTSNSDAKKSGFGLKESFNGGDKAIEFAFLAEAPPAKIRDQSMQPFVVRLSVDNLGEFDIPENSAYVSLEGFRPEVLGMTEEQTSKPIQALRGIKKQGSNVIPGGKQQISFENLKYTDSVVSGVVPFTIYANVCYPYQTKSRTIICVNGNTVPAIDKKTVVCNLEEAKESANSGGPIKISNVKEYPYGTSSIQFQFDIVHKPTSTSANVYERGSIDSKCDINGKSAGSPDALYKKDRVKYTVETGLTGLNCESTGSNTNTVSLTNNMYTVTCIQDTTDQNEYNQFVSITLDYDYLDRKDIKVNVEHIQR